MGVRKRDGVRGRRKEIGEGSKGKRGGGVDGESHREERSGWKVKAKEVGGKKEENHRNERRKG